MCNDSFRLPLLITSPIHPSRKRKATIVRNVRVVLIVVLDFDDAAALNTPEMLADHAWLVLPGALVDNLGEQGAVGALSNAVTFDHVGVE